MIKEAKTLLFISAAAVSASSVSQAAVIWSEDFDDFTAGSIDGLTTEVGSGTFDTTSNVVALGDGTVKFTQVDNTRQQFAVTSTAGLTSGNLQIDAKFLGDFDTAAADTDLLFLQLVDGTTRNTGGSPQPNFSDNFDASEFGLNNTTFVAVNYFFNVTGAAVDYLDPNGGTSSIANNTYSVWSGTSLVVDGQDASNNAGGFPANVDTFFIQGFLGQAGLEFVFDSVSLNTLTVPEPSSYALLSGLLALGFVMTRRRK